MTATAAIETGRFTPSSTLSGRNGILVSGVPLHNDQDENFGQLTLTSALAKSVNTVWAQVAERVGKPTLARYMNRFGFDAEPQLDYPAGEMTPSGEYEDETPAGADEPAGRRGAHGHRPGQTAGDAAADGGGRGSGGQPRAG